MLNNEGIYVMNILVIGNGFDLAHGLPTSYRDFLKFTDDFMDMYKARKDGRNLGWEDSFDKKFIPWINELLKDANKNEISEELVKELASLIEDNLWIEHFKNVQISDGWVDFEKEISRIIRVIDDGRKTLDIPLDEYRGSFKSKIEEKAYTVLNPDVHTDSRPTMSFQELKDKLLSDLNRTIRALEIYLSGYVEEISIETHIPEIRDISADRVLSFNYTGTFERVYREDLERRKKDVRYDYIHGKATKGISLETCNMVLGIDEYLNEPECNGDNEFIEFKKFYQRIYKRTGNEYKK